MPPSTFSTLAVADLLDAFASNDPVPGGGSAAALAGAVGASLLLMAASIARTRSGTPEETADLAEAAARVRPLRETLLALVDDDSEAYAAVVAALKLPKGSDEEKAARREALDTAMRGATETPLETMRACRAALREAPVVARACTVNASSDVFVAVELLTAALRGAAQNVETNLPGLKDAAYVERTRAEQRRLQEAGEGDARAARKA